MSTNNRYSLRSCAYDLGTVSSRTRSRSGDVSLVAGIASPVRKRGIRIKTEPVAGSVVFKLEPNVQESSVQTTVAKESLVQKKIEPLEESSYTFSTATLNSSNIVPEIEYPSSPVPSSRSSSPIFLRAESPASPSLTSASSLSSLSSDTSQSSTSSCSSFHLYSSSPSPPRDNDNMNYYYPQLPPPPPPPAIIVPSYSTAKVWDWHCGQRVVRELPLVAPVRQSVCTYPRKTYYKKPYKPYWEKNLKRDDGRRICNCQCRHQNNVASFNSRAITTSQNVNKPMNIHCNITINAPSAPQSSAFIEELSDQQPNNSKTSTQTRAPGLAPAVNSSISTPVIIPVPVPVPVPQSSYYQPNTQISYSYMGHNVSCSTIFH